MDDGERDLEAHSWRQKNINLNTYFSVSLEGEEEGGRERRWEADEQARLHIQRDQSVISYSFSQILFEAACF